MARRPLRCPDFLDSAAEWTGSQRLMVGIPDPDTLLLCAAGSPVVRRVQEATLGSQYAGAVDLTPCLLFLDHGRLSLEANVRSREIRHRSPCPITSHYQRDAQPHAGHAGRLAGV